jgi:hypothetical protein
MRPVATWVAIMLQRDAPYLFTAAVSAVSSSSVHGRLLSAAWPVDRASIAIGVFSACRFRALVRNALKNVLMITIIIICDAAANDTFFETIRTRRRDGRFIRSNVVEVLRLGVQVWSWTPYM